MVFRHIFLTLMIFKVVISANVSVYSSVDSTFTTSNATENGHLNTSDVSIPVDAPIDGPQNLKHGFAYHENLPSPLRKKLANVLQEVILQLDWSEERDQVQHLAWTVEGTQHETRHKLDTITDTLSEIQKTLATLQKTHDEPIAGTVIEIPSTPKEKLLKYLHRISNCKTISGLYIPNVGSKSSEPLETIHKIAGVYPGVISTEIPSPSAYVNLWKSYVDEVISNWRGGHLVRIEWDWGNQLNKMSLFTDTHDPVEVERRWEDLKNDGGYLNIIWKDQLDIIAPYLQQIQTAGVVPILDILTEVNQKFGIWKGRPGVNGTMKLYQLTHEYLINKHNLTSLIWTWSLHRDHLNNLEDFWPGSDYVDVASVYMFDQKELPLKDYQRLINVVGDKLISMEFMHTVPSLQLLAAQPRWNWFTATDFTLEDESWNSYSSINATFNSPIVINNGNIDFFF